MIRHRSVKAKKIYFKRFQNIVLAAKSENREKEKIFYVEAIQRKIFLLSL